MKKKLETNVFYSKEIGQNELFLNINQNNQNNTPTEIFFLYWETYVRSQQGQDGTLSYDKIRPIINWLFVVLGLLSLLGSLFLLSWDFNCSKLYFNTFNISGIILLCLWLILFIIFCSDRRLWSDN